MNWRRLLAAAFVLPLLAGCVGTPIADAGATPAPGDWTTPAAYTPMPTPTPMPELTTLDQAFELGKSAVRDMGGGAADPLEVFPFSTERLLTTDELRRATPRELEWAWREIAARRGVKEYKAYDFTDREWYAYDSDFVKTDFSQIEASNIIFLRNSALEHYTNMRIVKNNHAQADLNGDGKKESFSYTADRFSDSGVLQIGGRSFTIDLPQIDNRIYLCDIDRADDNLELAIPFTRPGNDYRLAFFAYDAEGLAQLGEVQGDRETVRIYNDGTIQAHALDDALCAWRYPLLYELQGDALTPLPLGLRKMNIDITLKAAFSPTDASGKTFPLEAGAKVILVSATPQDEYVLYEPASGRYGTFALVDGLIDGVAPDDLFEGLPTFA